MIDVAVVEPRYQINLGYIARTMKNFGAGDLYLVNPKCNYTGAQSIKYSKHAHGLLERARVVDKIASATKGAFVIGTTGIWSKTSASFRNVYTLKSAARLLSRASSRGRIVVLLGRDGTGLTKEELRECDATVFIAADKGYPVLNISHALAILLYELTAKRHGSDYGFMDMIYADERDKKTVLGLFERLVSRNGRIRDKNSVVMAFRHILNRSVPTRKELNAMAIALSKDKQ